MTALELIKASFQSRESLVLVIRDEEAKKVLVAWTIYRPEYKDFNIKSSDNPIICLGRLWQSVGPLDFARLADTAGVPETRAQKIFERLRASGLAYPDGTINKYAMAALRVELTTFIEGKLPKGWVPREPVIQQGPKPVGEGVPQPSAERVSAGPASAPRANKSGHRAASKPRRKGK